MKPPKCISKTATEKLNWDIVKSDSRLHTKKLSFQVFLWTFKKSKKIHSSTRFKHSRFKRSEKFPKTHKEASRITPEGQISFVLMISDLKKRKKISTNSAEYGKALYSMKMINSDLQRDKKWFLNWFQAIKSDSNVSRGGERAFAK